MVFRYLAHHVLLAHHGRSFNLALISFFLSGLPFIFFFTRGAHPGRLQSFTFTNCSLKLRDGLGNELQPQPDEVASVCRLCCDRADHGHAHTIMALRARGSAGVLHVATAVIVCWNQRRGMLEPATIFAASTHSGATTLQ